MSRRSSHLVPLLSLSLSLVACSSGPNDGVFGGGGGESPSSSVSSSSSAQGGAGPGAGGGATTSSGTTGGGAAGGGGEGGGSTAVVDDPALPGPYTSTSFSDDITVGATGNDFEVTVFHPTSGPTAGPFPVVVFGHGFQLTPSRYLQYGAHLASHGFVVLLPDFPTEVSILPGGDNFTHVEAADDMLGALDWALADATLGPLSDPTKIGTSGHSLGGKLAFLMATRDAQQRVDAVIALDPVDGASGNSGCGPTDCPDVSAAMPSLPTAVLGETLDGTGTLGQACAPTAQNYATFYEGASSPALEVTVLGADHMSFLDDQSSCLACLACKNGSASNADVTAMSRAFMTAFFQRRLRGLTGYDTYLTGAEAQARYVSTNRATLRSK